MKKYILALDEGTTSARAIIFDKNGNAVSISQHEFGQIYPKSGLVEHDPLEIYSAQYSALAEAISKIDAKPEEIAAVGITNQRETTVVWDKNTGKPIYNAIVWQCRRSTDICNELKRLGYEDYIKSTTGLKIDAYFSATKIKWILDNVPEARKKANNGELLFGTIDTWLLWKLSEGRIHATDYTNASRTMLFDIHKLCWDKKLLEILDIPECMLPKVYSSSQIYGEVNILGAMVAVSGIAGDQQSALFGQRCFNAGDIKNTYGTGCFLLMNTGSKPFESKNGLVTTLAASQKNEKPCYALEGSVFVGGAVIQWLRDELNLISSSAESEAAATAVNDNGGVYIVPAFVGLGAPYWDMFAKGTITGLTRGSNKNHIIRASLESIAYQTNDLICAMRSDSGIEISTLKADGGACANNFLMQFQADISSIDIVVPDCAESTALGVAFLAGLAVGFWESKEEILSLEIPQKKFTSSLNDNDRSILLSGWKDAIERTKTN